MLISRLSCYLACCLQCNAHHLLHLASLPALPQDWEARSLVHHRSDFPPGTDRARPPLPPASYDLLFYFQYSTDVRILIFAVFKLSTFHLTLPTNEMNYSPCRQLSHLSGLVCPSFPRRLPPPPYQHQAAPVCKLKSIKSEGFILPTKEAVLVKIKTNLT